MIFLSTLGSAILVDAIGDERFRLLGSVAVNRVIGVDPWRNVPLANPGNVG